MKNFLFVLMLIFTSCSSDVTQSKTQIKDDSEIADVVQDVDYQDEELNDALIEPEVEADVDETVADDETVDINEEDDIDETVDTEQPDIDVEIEDTVIDVEQQDDFFVNRYQSGSRIRMLVGSTPDGAKDMKGWYDTLLDTKCEFIEAADGQTRCFPSPMKCIYKQDEFISYYSDPSCNNILHFTLAFCSKENQSYSMSCNSCGDIVDVYRIEAKYTGIVYKLTQSGCIDMDSSSLPFIFYETKKIDIDTVQTMKVEIE